MISQEVKKELKKNLNISVVSFCFFLPWANVCFKFHFRVSLMILFEKKKKRELQEPIKNLVWGLIPA